MTYILEEKLWLDGWLAYRLILQMSLSPSYSHKEGLQLSYLLFALN